MPLQWWYQANHEDSTNTITTVIRIKTPEEFEGICYWWVG